MNIAEINVAITATDNASGVIAGVASSLSGLGSLSATAAASTASVNTALDGTAKSGTAADKALTGGAKGLSGLGAAAAGAQGRLRQLQSGLTNQRRATRQYTEELRTSVGALRDKQAAVKAASAAYKENKSSISQNLVELQAQRAALDKTIDTRKGEIDTLLKEREGLKRNSAEYKANVAARKTAAKEMQTAEVERANVTASIREQEAALASSEAAYKKAQSEVSAAAHAHDELKGKIVQSTQAEADYTEAIARQEKFARAERIQQTGRQIKDTAQAVDAITKPIQKAAMVTAGLGAASGLAAIRFEDNFANVKKTVEGTPEQLEAVKQGLIDLTTTGVNGRNPVRATTAELTELAAAGGQLGIETENIVEFTEVMAQMQSATNLGGASGAQSLARFMNVANVSQDQVRNLGSAVVDLGNNFATTEAEIVDMALDMGATGATVGMSAQSVLGYATGCITAISTRRICRRR